MPEEISPKLRIKASLGAVVMALQAAGQAVDRDDLASFSRWMDTLGKSLELLASEAEKYVDWKTSPPKSLKDRLGEGTGN